MLNKNKIINLFLFTTLACLLVMPFLLKPKKPVSRDLHSLVIISPHNEAVRVEFASAFRAWHKEHYGYPVKIEWRNIGGTSEIMRYLDGEYKAAARANQAGIGIDLLFGGGQYDHARQAKRGQTHPSRIRLSFPAWFAPEIFPASFTGETFYDPGGHWYGCCLSSFGICYNLDVLNVLGIQQPPQRWEDLADYKYFGKLALADPTKSGSINKAFEVLIQAEMSAEISARGKNADTADISDLSAGWQRAWNLLREIGANARYFTDAASLVPLDVAQGNAAAGMCIDFYGRFENEIILRNEGSDRLRYLTPADGSGIAVDPISILKGAKNLETAEHFVEFCLSVEGQKLWNYKPGTPGGPERYALRRLPVRRDLYQPEHLPYLSDPEVLPYENTAGFTYHPDRTAPLFGYIRMLMRAMCLDSHSELQDAWKAINAQPLSASQKEALAVFYKLPPEAEFEALHKLAQGAPLTRAAEIRLAREWMIFFRRQYAQTINLIREYEN